MTPSATHVTRVGRYAIHRPLAAGGMATVHLGRLLGAVGFARTVAIKRLHAHFANDPEFVDMLVDEARIAGRIQHPNVVQTLDVVTAPGELLLVMEYVHGQSLSRLVKDTATRNETIPLPIVSAIISGMLHGLHAAHEAKSDTANRSASSIATSPRRTSSSAWTACRVCSTSALRRRRTDCNRRAPDS
jgi:eukaryotic-like serine/threonine-protein kinase